MDIKRWWFERSIPRDRTSSHYFGDRRNKHIGILCDSLTDHEMIEKFSHAQRLKGNKVSLLYYSYIKLGEKDETTFDSRDVSWAGIPKAGKILDFINHQFDISYFVLNRCNLPLEYIIRTSKASLKIGFYHKIVEPYLDYSIIADDKTFSQRFQFLLQSSQQLVLG
jgi:hypothetical protein